jgi:hypothetical protein
MDNFNNEESSSSMVCITKLSEGWKPEKCESKTIEN